MIGEKMNDLIKHIYEDLFGFKQIHLYYNGRFVYNYYLDLNNCTSLTKLPDGLYIDSSLSLNDCTSLTRLPDGLRVGGFLDLQNCKSLTKLPDGLRVGNCLYLPKGNKIKIPKDAVIKGRMIYG